MPVMSRIEQAWCRSLPWRTFTRRVVLPWAIGDDELHGDVLEIGSGSGAMAAEILHRYPTVRLTATDVDPAMRAAAAPRLAPFGDRAEVREADATRLPFDDGSFDTVVSFIMLHHVIEWERAHGEVARVLRPGGVFVGYDLVESVVSRSTHRRDGATDRMAAIDDLRRRLAELPFDEVRVRPAFGRIAARFRAHRRDA